MALLPSSLRNDFPNLGRAMRGKPFTYLDSAASSLTPVSVIDAVTTYYKQYSVNIHRGVYAFSEEATEAHHQVRGKIKNFIGCGDEGEVVLTHGSTEGSNLIAYGWGLSNLGKGDLIVTSELEHHSTLVPWQMVAQKTGAQLAFIPWDVESNCLDYTVLEGFASAVKVVVASGMSNVGGYENDIGLLSSWAHNNGAILVLDGAQLVSHKEVNVSTLGCDFLYFSAHKMLGPTGVGALYGTKAVLEATEPFLYGGDMILEVGKFSSSFQQVPEKFEAGTPAIEGALGFGAALDYLRGLGMDAIEAHEAELGGVMAEQMQDIDGLHLVAGSESGANGIVSFTMEGVHPHDIGTFLDAQGVAIRTGFHCAMPFMKSMGLKGTARASLYLYNDFQDVERFIGALKKIRSMFPA